ncbi:MAG TPA: SRPBCC domain-containing protein, partial [Edaphobacter sp.]
MFTDAEHISNWWGPRGFTTKTERMDVRPGGLWVHTMISAEGVKYPNEVRFVEVEAPSRIVYDHISGPLFRATITFIDVGAGRTEVNFEMEFAT